MQTNLRLTNYQQENIKKAINVFKSVPSDIEGENALYEVEKIIKLWQTDLFAHEQSSKAPADGLIDLSFDVFSGDLPDEASIEDKLMVSRPCPRMVDIKDIYVTLGSPWVPTDVIDSFIEYLAGAKTRADMKAAYATRHDEFTGIWEIPRRSRFRYTSASVRDNETYGTRRMGMLYLLEAALNMRTPEITDPDTSSGSNTGKRIKNEKETMLAIEKQNVLIETFQDWVWTDADRAERLKEIYNEKYVEVGKTSFDGSSLTFPGMSKDVSLFPYQKDAVARIICMPNTLLAHEVGSGKTYVMIAAGMELRRLGKSKKNLYVVPNNLIGQWEKIFLEMYPDANLLVVDPKTFSPDKRNSILMDISQNDYDGIIMAFSCFDMLPLSKKYYQNYYKEQEKNIIDARANFSSRSTTDRKLKSIQKTLSDIYKKTALCSLNIYFDDLGINTLFVDECSYYKNVPIDTKVTHVHNISTSGSEKCSLMMDKVRCIQRENDGRGIVFATGTPITNSITDIFVMQKYLQNGELALLGIQNFDSWLGMFAEKSTGYEIDVDTNSYHLVTRFANFHNLPELTALLSSIADFHKLDVENEIPVLDGYTDVELPGSSDFESYLKDISKRADDVRRNKVKKSEDNLLKITTDGRKAALDMRLIDEEYSPYMFSKVESCARNVYEIYKDTKGDKLTQLIFCDISTPKKGFNMYDELKTLLVSMGADSNEIAFIHSASTEAKRESLFRDIRKGKIRILIGSTFKLGLGVNVQDRLVAIHHLDVPWRPADMIQREGRILRKGNINEKVKIFRYVTKGSFDSYSWQLLETKQRFISELLSGSLEDRKGKDVDETVLNYAEIKALAVGNPLMKTRCELINEISRERLLQREYVEMRQRLQKENAEIPEKIEQAKQLIKSSLIDKERFEKEKREYSKEELKSLREVISKGVSAGYERMEDRFITSYQGFNIYTPAYMIKDKPMLLIEGEGKYYLELGKSAGITVRLKNFTESFDKRIADCETAIESLKKKKIAITEELKKNESHENTIVELSEKLKKIDKELKLR